MTIEIITMWYNEEFLAPFFLRHYSYADKITLLYDRDTTDKTLEIATGYPNVVVKPFRFPDMLDEGIKQIRINNAYAESSCDWALLVDADEFAFVMRDAQPCADIRETLERCEADAIHMNFLEIHNHQNDAELDPALPAVPQRRHGVIGYGKPCAAKTGLGLTWSIGSHSLVKPLPEGLRLLTGILHCAHWSMADPCFCFKRRLQDRRGRQSKINIERGMDCHNHSITLKDLKETVSKHLDDPIII